MSEASEQIASQLSSVYTDYNKLKTLVDLGFFLQNYIVEGGAVTKDVTYNNTINVTEIVVSLDNDVTRRGATSFKTKLASTTYYLDYQAGDFTFNTSHPTGSYLPVSEVTTDSNKNVSVITDKRGAVGGFRLLSEYGLSGYMHVYNVTDYGAKGSPNDDTSSIQASIDAAIAAGSKSVFFPTGTYSASALNNLSQVNLIGDNATLTVGGDGYALEQVNDPGLKVTSDNLSKVVRKMQLGQAVKIVCYGDSITWGDNGLGGQSATPYPMELQLRLRMIYNNNNITVVNNGTNGQQSDEALANYDTVVKPQKPDLVIIMYGINDSSGYVLPTNAIDKYKANISGMIEKSIKNNFGVMIMTPSFTVATNGSNSTIEMYGRAATEVCKQFSVPYVDLHKMQQEMYMSGSAHPARLINDQYHFTDQGYQLIADFVLQQHLDINSPNSLIVKSRDTLNVPAVNNKFVKSDGTGTSANAVQASVINYFFKKDGTSGTFLSLEFYVNVTGMDLYLIAPKSVRGGKLTILDNGSSLPSPINFYSEEDVSYDVPILIYENAPLGYHKLEFKTANLVQGDGNTTNPEMYFSQFYWKPTERITGDINTASDNTSFPSYERLKPVLDGGISYKSTGAYSSIVLKSGKLATVKTGKILVIEAEGIYFDKSGFTWFSNSAGNTNTLGFNNGYALLLGAAQLSLYHSGVNNAQTVFTGSTASITLDFTKTHKVRIEHSDQGVIKVYVDGTLYITATSTRYNGGYFGFYNQPNAGKTMQLTRFEFGYY